MKRVQGSGTRVHGSTLAVQRIVVLGLTTLLGAVGAESQLLPCGKNADPELRATALRDIRNRLDPCGESAEVTAVLEALEQCTRVTYQICIDLSADRNVFDRPADSRDALARVITWNPQLRSEVERGCGGDPDKPVLRDPTASLLHELVHAAQDCAGLNPGEHELEAVRIENIYRRAAGLCQRRVYGDLPLPPEMTRTCSPRECTCSSAAEPAELPMWTQATARGASLDAPVRE